MVSLWFGHQTCLAPEFGNKEKISLFELDFNLLFVVGLLCCSAHPKWRKP